ncbi:MAG TPA: hypothetical protein PKW56_00975 [Clostridiales bacterium]|nr:hypothetical protein [Clostridiales bacterium]
MINKSKIASIIYFIIFMTVVYFTKKEDIIEVAAVLIFPLVLIWIGEWIGDNFGGTIIGLIAIGNASFLEGKAIPYFGWFILIFYSILWFFLPNFTEIF